MTKQITVTITRTFTPDDDRLGLFSLLEAAGDLNNAETEVRYETMMVDDAERRERAVDALLDDAVWVIEAE